jgi:hypothetical protein
MVPTFFSKVAVCSSCHKSVSFFTFNFQLPGDVLLDILAFHEGFRDTSPHNHSTRRCSSKSDKHLLEVVAWSLSTMVTLMDHVGNIGCIVDLVNC